MKLNSDEIIDIGPLSGDFKFNMEACTVLKMSKVCFNDWLNVLSKDYPLKMNWRVPDVP